MALGTPTVRGQNSVNGVPTLNVTVTGTTAGSLLIAQCRYGSATDVTLSGGVTGMDGTDSWVEITRANGGGNSISLWACVTNATSGTVTMTHDTYGYASRCRVIEITGAPATVAAAVGVSDSNAAQAPFGGGSVEITLGAFADAGNMTLIGWYFGSGLDPTIEAGFTQIDNTGDVNSDYQNAEENTVTLTASVSYQDMWLTGAEIIPSGGGGSSIPVIMNNRRLMG